MISLENDPIIEGLAKQAERKSKRITRKIGELKSGVSELAMNAISGENTQMQNNPRRDARMFGIIRNLDIPFQGNFPERNIQFEGDTSYIEEEIVILQKQISSFPLSTKDRQFLETAIVSFRYGIHDLHPVIWSAYNSGNQEEFNKVIGLTNKLISEMKLELAVLLHRYGVTKNLHPYYQGKKAVDPLTKALARRGIIDPEKFLADKDAAGGIGITDKFGAYLGRSSH